MQQPAIIIAIGAAFAMAGLGACAPAPLYTASGSSRSQMQGEIPRDGRGEPIWHLIRPAGANKPVITLEQVESMQRAADDEIPEQGSRRDDRPR